jgi:CO/xanthine dehydrogenase FAD-binding subunit
VWQEYLFAGSVDEALQMLAARGGRARLIAGGTDLVLQAQEGKQQPACLVDITRIPGLSQIAERDGFITIGAQATHAQAAASELIRAKAKVLALACACVGGPQIRNVGTLVGNVVNALPAADAAVALFALNAEAEVADVGGGRRWLPIAALYRGVGLCAISPAAEMVTALRFPALGSAYRCAFKRLAPRRALSLPILNVAVVVAAADERISDAGIADVRIAIGPVAPTPFRAQEAEAALIGQRAEPGLIAKAAHLAAEAAKPRSSVLRGSAEYRKGLVEVFVRRALTEATEQNR